MLAALAKLLTELIDGSGDAESWVLNPHDPGLLRSLDKLSAEAASAVPPGGSASIAAQVDHLCYGLSLLNRWQKGEPNPFATADYRASWSRVTVTESEWVSRREALRHEAYDWRDALPHLGDRALSDFEQAGVLASVVHLAYHLGAIRQIDRTTRGPSAKD